MNIPRTYDLIFITTFVVKDNVDNLLASLKSNRQLDILVLVVCQGGNIIDEIFQGNTIVKGLLIDSTLGLSAARNIAIRFVVENQIMAEHVMFPDDDSLFAPSFFERYKQSVCRNVNYIIDVYSTGTTRLFKSHKYSANKQFFRSDWKVACSVNMLISYDSFITTGFFDENLGVGTKYGAGEDNDYFIRVCSNSDCFLYNKQLYNYHPAPKQIYREYTQKQLIRRYNSYGKGLVYCLCKHRMIYSAVLVCCRAIGGALWSLVHFQFSSFVCYLLSFFARISVLLLSLIMRFFANK